MLTFLAGLLAGILAAGSIWFWIVLAIAAISIIILVEVEQGGWATFALLVGAFLINWIAKGGLLTTLTAHPWVAVKYVVFYFLIGCGWGMVKWFFFLHKRLSKYNEYRQKFLRENQATELTPALAKKFLKWLADVQLYNYNQNAKITAEAPLAKDHKGDIIRWMSYWPFSMIGTLLNDVVRKAWKHIYNFMAKAYDAVSSYVFRNAANDAALANQTTPKPDEDDDQDGTTKIRGRRL